MGTSSWSRSRAALASGLLLVLGLAALQAQEPPKPVFRTAVRAVVVDVSVTGRGDRPVDGLRAEDFELEEDGVPQTIESVQFVRLDGQPSADEDSLEIRSPAHAAAEAARDDVRVFVIFLDDYHIDKAPSINIPLRRALSEFVEQLGPTDLVAITDPLIPLSALRFTRSKAELLETIRKFEGRQGEIFPIRSALEEAQYQARNVRMVRAEVTLSALHAVVAHLGGLREGRKSVIFVSQGPPTRFGYDGDIEPVMQDLLQAAMRGSVTIHTLDPRGLGMEGRGGVRDTLYRLSAETGGRAVVNTNGLSAGLRKILDDVSAYYLLAYTPTREADDGKFHKITVRVKRPGTRVLARRGYWAPAASEVAEAAAAAARPAVPGVREALAPLVTSETGRVVDVWVGEMLPRGPVTPVRVTWEPAAAAPGGSSAAGRPPVALSVEALRAEDGAEVVPGQTIASARGVVAEGAVAEIELPAGAYTLRFSALSDDGTVLDRWTQPLSLAEPDPLALVIETPVFRRARSGAEFRAISSAPSTAPTAARDFRRSDRVLVEAAWAPADDLSARVEASLLNRDGAALVTLPVRQEPGRVALELPVASLVPTTYLVRIRVQAGDRNAERMAAFRVVP